MGPIALLPLMMRPLLAFAAAGAAAAVWLASRSVVYPLALSGLAPVALALVGSNPFPSGTVTIAGAAWVAVALFLAVVRDRDVPPLRVFLSPPVIVSVALLGWMLLRLGGSPEPEYGTLKVQLFVGGNLLFLVAGIFVAWNPANLRRFLGLTLAVGTAAGLLLLIQLVQGTGEAVLPSRYAISTEEDPISLGRTYGAALVIGLALVLGGSASPVRLLATATIPLFALALFASGSRGPVVAAFLGILVFIALSLAGRAARRRLLLVAAGLTVALTLAPQLIPDTTIARSLSFLTTDVNLSGNGRVELWRGAYEDFGDAPLVGLGTGGFAAEDPTRVYPHNLLLEAATELGLVGLVLMVAFLVSVVAAAGRGFRGTMADGRWPSAVLVALFTLAFVNANFSGDFTHNRALWLWAGGLVGLRAARELTPAARRDLILRPAPA